MAQLSKIKGPLLLIGVLLFSLFLGQFVPTSWKSIAYSVSLTIKETLIFILPLLIFSFVFSSMVNLRTRALRFVLLIIPLVCLSSYCATWLAYLSGNIFIASSTSVSNLVTGASSLVPAWEFQLPKLISNDWALFIGLAIGLVAAFRFPVRAEFWSERAMTISHGVLNKVFIPLMPIFILGFTLKLEHDQILQALVSNYLSIFLIILCSVFSYLLFVYAALSRFNWKVFAQYLQNMSSAVVAGFSTMSSAAAMPLTLIAGEKNTGRPEISGSVIPATTNIHLIGDCFAIPIFALAILLSFGQGIPGVATWAVFALYFVLAKFAVAGVPGGGILVMLPVLEQHLGFSAEMLSLITALYIIFDPIITAANVTGNGAFAIFFTRVFEAIDSLRRRK